TRVVHVNDNVPGAVYIGRAVPRRGLKASIWANPFRIGEDGSRAQVIEKYREGALLFLSLETYMQELRELAGKPLACWCRHDGEERTEAYACHVDVLVKLIRELGLEEDL